MKKSELGDNPEGILNFIFNKLEELPKGSEDYEKAKNSLYGLIYWVKGILESKQYDLLYFPFFLIGIEYQALSNYNTSEKAKKYDAHKTNRMKGLSSWQIYRQLVQSHFKMVADQEWKKDSKKQYRKTKMAEICQAIVRKDRDTLIKLRTYSKSGAEPTIKELHKLENVIPDIETIKVWINERTPDYAKAPGRPKLKI